MSSSTGRTWSEIKQNAGQIRKTLTVSQQRLLDALLDGASMSAFMTAEELGGSVGVSEATVIRFSQSLGFESYIGLKSALATEVRQHLSPSARLEKLSIHDSLDELTKGSLRTDQTSLAELAQRLELAVLERAVDLICNARTVNVVGSRSSYSLSHLLVYLLDQIMPSVRQVNVDSGPNASIHHAGPDDVVVAFSYPRYSKLSVDSARALNKMGAKVIAITDSYAAPITEVSEVTLIAPCESVSFFNSSVAATCLVNLLVTLVADKKSEDSVSRLKSRETTMREIDILLQ